MKKLLLTVVALASIMGAKAQIIFQEDFDGISGSTAGGAGTYSFPSGWSLFNVDALAPNASVAYVNEAWERREDFSLNVADSAAFSTSWYSPVGTADDWMFTPAITIPANAVLSWNAVAYDASYPDGYQVRIMTTAPNAGNVMSSTVLQTIAAENSTWTARTQNLNAYAGQTVYIAFRNNSVNMFLLLIDDVKVEVSVNFDAQLVSADTLTEYTLIPQTQTAPLVFLGDIKNNGNNALTNVRLNVTVKNSANSTVYSASSAATGLASGATATYNVAGFTPTAVDNYTVKLYATAAETDQLNSNDTITRTVTVTDSTYARDNGAVTGALGIGAGNGGYLGQDFEVLATDDLTSVSVYYSRGYTNRKYALAIWNMSAGVPSTIIGTTDTLLYPDNNALSTTVPMHNGALTLTPGRYAVTAIEFTADSTVQVGLTNEFFTRNRTWVNWPTNPLGTWGNNEDFGASFAKSYVIRPNFGCVTITSSQTLSICAGNSVSVGSNTYTTTGVYTDVLTAINGCDSVVTTNLTVAPAINVATTTLGNAITASSSTGTFQWIDCNNGNAIISGETNQTYTASASGDYAVVVTVGSCSDTSSCVNITVTGITEASAANQLSVYPNPNTGSFVINATEAGKYIIFNELGQEVKNFELSAKNNFTMSINDLSNGVYMISGVSKNKTTKQRIVVNK